MVREGVTAEVGAGDLVLEHGDRRVIDAILPSDLPVGYHEFTSADGAARTIIVAPPRCHLPPDWRAWGWAAQLYATRSHASWGIGDLADLAQLARWTHARGGGFVLVNPVGAVAPTAPQQPSPYFPASRRFRNPIYLRVENVPGARHATGAVQRAATAGRDLNRVRVIDRDAVWQLKREALEAIWTARPPIGEFDEWYASQPPTLREFATWCVLCEQLGARWRSWPADLRDHDAAAVTAVSKQHADRVRFHAWLQWNTEQQLQAAAATVALVQDLPIGVDPDGFDAWAWQDVLAADTSVGAPPDEFNQLGQNWGLPPFVPHKLAAAGYQPFIDTIRSSLASGGGLRIDHVMGLLRLWWIPNGNPPAAGAYVRYPADDLLAIVALESQRARAFVVGEDLGTVEPAARHALAENQLLSYRLLWFEEDDPATWPRAALSAITTHDLPTVVGLWTGSDLAAQHALGLDPNDTSTKGIRAQLADATALDDHASADEVVVAAHELLARAPSVLLAATLDDAVAEPERPNIPGADDQRANWSLALPLALDDIEMQPLATTIARVLDDGIRKQDR